MKSRKDLSSILILTFVALLGLSTILVLASPAARAQKNNKNQYHYIEVVRFDIKEGVEFPPDYLIATTENTVKKLQKTRKFKEVLRQGETPTEANADVLRLTGTVTEFRKGSRAKRSLLGTAAGLSGLGKTKVVVHINFLDGATGRVLAEKDVQGVVIGGDLFSEDSLHATDSLANEIAKTVKKQFF